MEDLPEWQNLARKGIPSERKVIRQFAASIISRRLELEHPGNSPGVRAQHVLVKLPGSSISASPRNVETDMRVLVAKSRQLAGRLADLHGVLPC